MRLVLVGIEISAASWLLGNAYSYSVALLTTLFTRSSLSEVG